MAVSLLPLTPGPSHCHPPLHLGSHFSLTSLSIQIKAHKTFSVPTFVPGIQKPQAEALVPQRSQSSSGGQVCPGAGQLVGNLSEKAEESVNSEAWRSWGNSGPLVKGKDLSGALRERGGGRRHQRQQLLDGGA